MRATRILKRGILAAVLAAAPLASASAAEDGRAILDLCNAGDFGDHVASMSGGMAFGLLTGQGLGGPKRQFCPPNNGRLTNGRLTNGQYRSKVCAYLADHAEVVALDSYTAIGIALLKSYPCAAEKP